MHEHVFVDESKADGFLLAAVIVRPGDLASLRRVVRSFRLPGQQRIHFATESHGRRKRILRAYKEFGVTARIYDARAYTSGKEARDVAIAQLADDVASMGADRLLLELDDSVAQNDRRIIRSRLMKAGAHDTVRYCHMRASEECLLAVPDGIAWGWARGGHWRHLVAGMTTEVLTL